MTGGSGGRIADGKRHKSLTDWVSLFYRIGNIVSYTIKASGGNDQLSYDQG